MSSKPRISTWVSNLPMGSRRRSTERASRIRNSVICAKKGRPFRGPDSARERDLDALRRPMIAQVVNQFIFGYSRIKLGHKLFVRK